MGKSRQALAMSAKETEAGAEARSKPTLCLLGANTSPRPVGPFFGLRSAPSSAPTRPTTSTAWLSWHQAGSQKPGLCPESDNRWSTIHILGGCVPAPLKTPVCFSRWESIPQPGIRDRYNPVWW